MSITLSDAIMDELNKEALHRTDKFISDGLEVAQKAIEFRREVSFTHGCIDSACTYASALKLPNTSRRVVALREDTRQIKDQSNEWLVKATRLIKKLDGAGAALVVSAALNNVLYSGKDKDDLHRRCHEGDQLFLGFTLAGDGPVSAVLGMTSPYPMDKFFEASDRIAEVVVDLDRDRLVNMANNYLSLWGASRNSDFAIQARRISSPWKVWGDVMDLEKEITNLLVEGDKILGDADKAFEELKFIRDMYDRGAFVIEATDVINGGRAKINLAEVEDGTVVRASQWSGMRTPGGWAMDYGMLLDEDEMASNAHAETYLSVIPVSDAGITAI